MINPELDYKCCWRLCRLAYGGGIIESSGCCRVDMGGRWLSSGVSIIFRGAQERRQVQDSG